VGSCSDAAGGERADQLSRFATYFGEPERVNGEAARYREVTVEAVSAFARERLGGDNRAFLIFVPKDGDGGAGGARAGEARAEEAFSDGAQGYGESETAGMGAGEAGAGTEGADTAGVDTAGVGR
jgi:hypothetical protein